MIAFKRSLMFFCFCFNFLWFYLKKKKLITFVWKKMRCRFVLVPICLDTELSFSMGAEMSWCRTVLLPYWRCVKTSKYFCSIVQFLSILLSKNIIIIFNNFFQYLIFQTMDLFLCRVRPVDRDHDWTPRVCLYFIFH